MSGPRPGEEERTAPEITVSGAPGAALAPEAPSGSVDEVLLDLGDDTGEGGILDLWRRTAEPSGDPTGDATADPTAAERTGELRRGAGATAAPTDVRLLGALLRFAGPDPETRARQLAAESTRSPPAPGFGAWLARQPLSPLSGLFALDGPAAPAPPAVGPAPAAAAGAPPLPVPAGPSPRSFGLGLALGVAAGLALGIGALLLLR